MALIPASVRRSKRSTPPREIGPWRIAVGRFRLMCSFWSMTGMIFDWMVWRSSSSTARAASWYHIDGV